MGSCAAAAAAEVEDDEAPTSGALRFDLDADLAGVLSSAALAFFGMMMCGSDDRMNVTGTCSSMRIF